MATAKPISYNEMRDRAVTFATRWRAETRENAESQTFWNEWFAIFGIDRRRFVTFEKRAQRESTGGRGRIDAFWAGQIAVEHKSAGRSLADAEQQAFDYLNSLTGVQHPRLIVTSDFGHMRVLDLEKDETTEFALDDLPKHIGLFGFLAGYETRTFQPEDEVNIKAAEKMGALYDALAATGYSGHELKVFLVRLMFLFFADDTGVWQKGLFQDFLDTRTAEDGSDTGPLIGRLFSVLDTPEDRRTTTLDQSLARFPYVNGGMFRERIEIPDFDTALRQQVIACSAFDWTAISPAIFGSMFQSVMDQDARRALGAHYTTEQNILKLIGPLFLDELRADFEAVRNNGRKLRELHSRLAGLTFFDPAAGSGNFLIIAYRELRRLEFDVLVRLDELEGAGQQHLSIDTISGLSKVDVDQFYAIEIEEFPARIAETALYLVDHLENMRLSKHFGQYFARIPLKAAAHVHVANALRVDWNEVLPAQQCSYLLGNPPFIGGLRLDEEQTKDRAAVFAAIPEAADLRTGRLDYVMCWYAKALKYMNHSDCRAAFVSTNSVTQGEQARSLGPLLTRLGYEIDFAHRTFNWSSQARGKAIVHVVIIGFSQGGHRKNKLLYDYPDIRQAPIVREARHINAWLADADDVVLAKRTKPFVPDIPGLTVGSQPTDGGHLLVSPEQLPSVEEDPIAAKYLRRYFGADEMLNETPRWCLWLVNATPQDLRNSPVLKTRLEAVRAARLKSPTVAFQRAAETPHLFTHRKHPEAPYVGLPQTSSEHRRVIPAAFYPADEIASNKVAIIPNAEPWLFALIQSAAFTTWAHAVGGRLKSDINITADLAYNAFPFPDLTDKAKERLTAAAQDVLDARAAHSGATLADLYDRLSMPLNLKDAHDRLDRLVDGMYGFRKSPTEAERVARLFERYKTLADSVAAGPGRDGGTA